MCETSENKQDNERKTDKSEIFPSFDGHRDFVMNLTAKMTNEKRGWKESCCSVGIKFHLCKMNESQSFATQRIAYSKQYCIVH